MAERSSKNTTVLSKYLTYRGRISRKQFVVYHLYAFVFCITLLNLILLAFPESQLVALKACFSLFCFISMLFCARRSHDLGWTSSFVPVLVIANIVLIFLEGVPFWRGEVKLVVGQGIQFITAGLFVYLLCQPGQAGDNRFGADPIVQSAKREKRRAEEFRRWKKQRETMKAKMKREQERRQRWEAAMNGAPIEVEPVENKPVDRKLVQAYTQELKEYQIRKEHHQRDISNYHEE